MVHLKKQLKIYHFCTFCEFINLDGFVKSQILMVEII